MKIMVAIPAYSGTIHLGTMRSLFTDLMALHARGDQWQVMDECGNALIADARALIVSKFLASDFDTLVFVDSDVCWEAGALVRLVDHPVDFSAGIYPQRRDPVRFCLNWTAQGELNHNQEIYEKHGISLLESNGVPFGFVKLTRKVLEDMREQYPDTEFYVENAPDQRAWALFADYRIGKHKMGEDYAFCRRWRDMGGQIWVDPEIRMGHVGYKTFTGHLGDWLRGRIDGREVTDDNAG